MIAPDQIIYLDNNATTPVDPAVAEEMLPFLTKYYGNPSSGYRFGAQVRDAVELARERVAALIGCTPGEIVFTSGGTESNNAAINSALQLLPDRRHIVTTAVEHSAVLRHCEHLARSGYDVTFIGVDENGLIDLTELKFAIRPDTAIVSAMWANNETGVLFPVAEMAQIAREKKVLFHSDAVQAAGKVPVSVSDLALSSLSLSAHKIYGPKGIGALYVNRRIAFRASQLGGSQENDRRAGTENVAGIVGFGKAAELAAGGEQNSPAMAWLRDRFESLLREALDEFSINGESAPRLPNTSSLSFRGIESDAALIMLDRHGICCSAGSACRTGSLEGSHVLQAMHVPEDQLRGSLRFSFGRFNTEADLDRAVEIIPRVVRQLREMRGASTQPALSPARAG
jgi:cysteine desulfurase